MVELIDWPRMVVTLAPRHGDNRALIADMRAVGIAMDPSTLTRMRHGHHTTLADAAMWMCFEMERLGLPFPHRTARPWPAEIRHVKDPIAPGK